MVGRSRAVFLSELKLRPTKIETTLCKAITRLRSGAPRDSGIETAKGELTKFGRK
jgi:hypothetical protein